MKKKELETQVSFVKKDATKQEIFETIMRDRERELTGRYIEEHFSKLRQIKDSNIIVNGMVHLISMICDLEPEVINSMSDNEYIDFYLDLIKVACMRKAKFINKENREILSKEL